MFDPSYKDAGKVDAYFTIYDSALAEKLGITEKLEEGLTSNKSHFFKADSLEEPASLCGFEEDTFLATVEEYKAGEDAAFGKDPQYLNAIAEDPFYCVKHELMSLDVTGGVHTNENFEVTKADGSVIPNFAVGSAVVADIVKTAGGANFACTAYTTLTAAKTIIGLLGN